jgi:hypothetical protein
MTITSLCLKITCHKRRHQTISQIDIPAAHIDHLFAPSTAMQRQRRLAARQHTQTTRLVKARAGDMQQIIAVSAQTFEQIIRKLFASDRLHQLRSADLNPTPVRRKDQDLAAALCHPEAVIDTST